MNIYHLVTAAAIAAAGVRVACAEAGSVDQPSAPKTYCNPMPLPGIPVNSGCRNGKPSRTPGSSYREIADPSFLHDNGTLYLYPSMGMAWKSKDCGATWEQIDVGVYDLGYAPTAVKHRGKYYLTTGGSQLHVADSPEGPFKPIGRIARPKVDGKEMSYDDPMLFSDDDERLYVYFGCSPRGGIWGIELDSKNPLAFIGEPKQLIKFEPEEHPWECKPNNLGEAWMEGSWMIKINGQRVEPGEIEAIIRQQDGIGKLDFIDLDIVSHLKRRGFGSWQWQHDRRGQPLRLADSGACRCPRAR